MIALDVLDTEPRERRSVMGSKIQRARASRDEMIGVARGERAAPRDAGRPSFESVGAVMRLLTPENRLLLALIRDRKPQSVAEPAMLTGRASSNLTGTLAKLETAGFVRMEGGTERRKIPTAIVQRLHVEIDPFSQTDRLETRGPAGIRL